MAPVAHAQQRPTMPIVAILTNWDILKLCYWIVCGLSLFMVFWILVIPSSWLMGHWEWHDRQILAYLPENGMVAPSTLTKFSGQTAVQLTHVLPGALWAGVIPFQLHPEWRKNYRRAHRCAGYAFIVASMSSAIGVVLILRRGLLFENFFDDLPPAAHSFTPLFLRMISLWFMLTAVVALQSARNRKFQDHQEWIYRHVASGIWVALQRLILIGPMRILYPPPVSRMRQRAAFGDAANISIAVCLIMSECCIHFQRQQINKKNIAGPSTKQS
jgi:Predicted membrane protein (DUF2306)